MKFAMFMIGEYVAMTLMAALMTTLFLGGWSLPFGLDHVPRRTLDHSVSAPSLSVGVLHRRRSRS